MVERLRLFRGATELTYNKLIYKKLNDTVVDTALTSIEADANVDTTSTLFVTKADGSTKIFSGKVQDKKERTMWDLEIYTNGYELINTRVQKVYTNISPEDIIKDVVNTFTNNLTYASTAVSGFTIETYIADAYAVDVINEMLATLEWGSRIDSNDNFFAEQQGLTDNGVTFTNGEQFGIDYWNEDKTNLFNIVRVVGGFQNYAKTESFTASGSQTTFTLAKKPQGTMFVSVDGTEQDPSTYTVESEDKQVILDTPLSGGEAVVIDYSYQRPIIVENQDDASILEFDEIYQKVPAPWLNTNADARLYAKQLLGEFSQPITRIRGFNNFLNFDVELNEVVTIVDPLRQGRTVQLVIQSIIYDGIRGTSSYEFGRRETVLFDWQRRVQDRIKAIERRFENEDEPTFIRTLKSSINVDMQDLFKVFTSSPENSLIANHTTLGYARADRNVEIDCTTGNTKNGTWQGTGIGGSQFSLTGQYRLSHGVFNGSDNSVDSNNDIDLSGDFSLFVEVNPDAIGSNEYIASQLGNAAGDFWLRINTDGTITYRRWTGTSNNFEEWTSAFTMSAGSFTSIGVTYDSGTVTLYSGATVETPSTSSSTETQSSVNLFVGKQASEFYDGKIDELILFDVVLTSTEFTEILEKKFYSNHARYSDSVIWYSFDDPIAGDFTTTPVQVV